MDLSEYSTESWDEAERRAAVIRKLVKSKTKVTGECVQEAAELLNLSVRQIHTLIRKFIAAEEHTSSQV